MLDSKDEHTEDVDIEVTGEDNVDEPELEAVEGNVAKKLKDVQTKLKTAETEKMDALEQLQRAKAEFLNARKRLEDEKVEAKERTIDAAAEKLLPLYDSFTMAMKNTEAWEAVDENWRSGVEAIYGQLTSLLQSYNVRELNPLGAEFDPELHEAMGYEDVEEEAKHDTIVSVLQIGFARGEGDSARQIRPARVIVGNYNG